MTKEDANRQWQIAEKAARAYVSRDWSFEAMALGFFLGLGFSPGEALDLTKEYQLGFRAPIVGPS